MENLSIFILCHNRSTDAKAAIQSVLNQKNTAFSLTISDNSSNDEVECMVKIEFPDACYIRRRPMLQVLEHFNQCIDEVKSSYFCLFHDDDVMNQDFFAEVTTCLHSHPNAIAFGCNANIEYFGKLQPQSSFLSFRQIEMISSSRDLAVRYFSRSQSGIAPFPGYVYKREAVGDLRFHPEGGKYSDVTWLLNLASKGPILWINKPLMTYRLHESNDGGIESRRDRLRFLGYLKKNLPELGRDILRDYRYSFIYKTVLNNCNAEYSKRKRLASAFLRKYRWMRYSRFDTYKALIMRTFVNWMAKK